MIQICICTSLPSGVPGIGTLYFREEIDTFNAAVRVLRMEDEKYVLCPVVTPDMFAGGGANCVYLGISDGTPTMRSISLH